MNRTALFRAPALVAVALAWLGADAASAAPLQCQAAGPTGYSGPPPYDVPFQSHAAGGNGALSFLWDFGDGASSDESNPTHTYAQSGFYQAILTVTDAGFPAEICRDTAVVLVNTTVDPSCGAYANTRWSESTDAIQFGAYPALIPEPPPYTWSWWFGDGATGTSDHVGHAYAVPGTYWAVVTLHTTGNSYTCWPILRVTTLVPQQVVGTGPPAPLSRLSLDAPRPNPFAAATAIAYGLPRPGHVRLAIVDARGRWIATLADEARPAGRHVAMWLGRSGAGRLVPPGLYFAVLDHEGERKSVRIVRVR
jgi:hypothetical protein